MFIDQPYLYTQSHLFVFSRPSVARCALWRLTFPFYYPLIKLQYQFSPLKYLITKTVEYIPDRALQNVKTVVGVMHATSLGIYQRQLKALHSNDDETNIKVQEGKDLMSILCT